MFKKALFLGIIGFLVSLIVVYLNTPKPEISSQDSGSLSYEDGIDGWISFGNILAQNISEAFAMKDNFFVSMFVRKATEETNLPNQPEVIVSEANKTIFWTNGTRREGTKYTGLQNTNNKKYVTRDSVSIVETEIISNNKELIGYLYLAIQNKPDVKEFAEKGWQFYGHVLSTSNDIRGYVDERNNSGIKNYIDRVTKKEDIINLTILGLDRTVVWSINNSNIGWIEQERGKESEDKFYFSQPINYQGREVANIHFLIKLPEKQSVASGNIMIMLKGIFKIKNLKMPFISFVVFFLFGSILLKSVPAGKTTKGDLSKGSPELQNKIQVLKEEIENLEKTKTDVIEEVAKKQKVQKDLEEEIKNLTEQKENISAEVETATATAAAAAATPEGATEAVAEEEKSEEDLLFDRLLGEDGKSDAKKKEELELTQRIVAKRREEIALSGKIEARRKELLKLEQDIEKQKNNQ
jgi:hypothetical protein